MARFVLVHGAWHGGWCWSRVLPLLRAAGHEAYAPTLTGLGERAHLLSAEVGLATHVDDVVNLIRCEELDEVVLVGHSYAGVVITGAADRLLQSDAGAIAHLVYLDAVVPLSGEGWSSQHPPEVAKARIDAARAGGGVSIPPPDSAVYGLNDADRAWVNRRLTPQPLRAYHDTLDFDAARVGRLPRTFIDCTDPALPVVDVMRARVRQDTGWRVVELATGHDAMVSAPQALAAVLLEGA